MRKLLLFALLLLPCALWGQDSSSTVLLFNGTPTGACPAKRLAVDYANNLLYFCSNAVWVPATAGAGTGSVTSVATTTPITGGTITTTGTIACATCVTSAAALASTALVIGGGLQATSTSANLTYVSPTLTIGVATSTTGVLKQTGASSGTVTVTPQAAAGTPTLTYPTASGTFAVSATAPIVVSATTGNITLNPATTSVQGGVIPRDNLVVDGSGNLDATPLDTTVINVDEEFLAGNAATGTIGAYGWTFVNIAGTSVTAGNATSNLPNYGRVTFSTGGTSGNGGRFQLLQTGAGGWGSIFSNAVASFDSYWIALLGSTSSITARIGYETVSSTAVIPPSGVYVRFDTNAANVASAVCNDAGNKCGLTTVTGATNDTVTFTIDGGGGASSATGSVALTGTNAIANGTAITVVGAGKGYTSTPAVGTRTGGTAASTGALALTVTLGAAASGADTTLQMCVANSSVETCSDSLVAASTNLIKLRTRWIAASKVGMTLYDATGAVTKAETTFCAAACDVNTAPPATSNPSVSVVTDTTGAKTVVVDAFKMKIRGLVR